MINQTMTIERTAYLGANQVARIAWGFACEGGIGCPEAQRLHQMVKYWQDKINHLNRQTMPPMLPERVTLSPLDELAGVGGTTRQYWRTHEAGGLSLQKVADQMRQLRKSGLLSGCDGVYITHERNTRGDKVYHRIRLNVCSQGRRVRRDLASYRVK